MTTLKASLLVILSPVLMTIVIVTCYILAVTYGHVPELLPYICECGALPPENYVYRMGMVTSAVLLILSCLLVYWADEDWAYAGYALLAGLSSVPGLTVASVLSYKEDINVHILATFMFFIPYSIYMMLFGFCYDGKNLKISIMSENVKKVCAIVMIVAVVISAFLFLLTCLSAHSILKAVLEWVGSIAVGVFNMTFYSDLQKFKVKFFHVEDVKKSK